MSHPVATVPPAPVGTSRRSVVHRLVGSVVGAVLAVVAVGACSTAATDVAGPPPTAADPTAGAPTAGAPTAGPPPTGPPAAGAPTPRPQGPGTCHLRGVGADALPDPACTPGATDPSVTPTDVATTICRRGWAASVRPPEAVTEALKLAQMAAYGEAGPPSAYEEDHLVPLELGGAPADPADLWPEPGRSPNRKDEVESAARRAVCDGRLPLGEAQREIAVDWVALGRRLGVA